MRRLYVHILLTVAAALALFALLAGVVWRSFGEQQWHSDRAAVAELLSAALPAPDSPPPAQQAALEKLAGKFKYDVSLYGADGIPAEWLATLHAGDLVMSFADRLHDRATA